MDQIRTQVENLMYSYCDFVDRAMTKSLIDLFAEDATLDYGFGRVFSGRKTILELFETRLKNYQATSHHLSNIRIISVNDKQVEISSSIYAWHKLKDGSHAEVWGKYSNLLEVGDSALKISFHKIRAAGSNGFATPVGLPSAFEPIETSSS